MKSMRRDRDSLKETPLSILGMRNNHASTNMLLETLFSAYVHVIAASGARGSPLCFHVETNHSRGDGS